MVTRARHRPWALLACLAAAFLLDRGRTQGDDALPGGLSDYKIKAAYLYYFSTFVDWPGEPPHGSDETLIIGVLGADPFGAIRDDTLRGKVVNNRRIVVKRFDSLNEARRSHILFVSSSEQDHLPYILKALDGAPVLTVGDIERFALLGGQIGFRVEDKKVRFDINLGAVERARLKISAQLMKLGRIVEDTRPPGG